MSLSSRETGARTKSTRLIADEHLADSLRETVRTPTKSMMQLCAMSSSSCQSGVHSGLRGQVVTETEGNVGTLQRLAAQVEFWRQGVQVSVNRRGDVVTSQRETRSSGPIKF